METVAEEWESSKALMEADGAERHKVADAIIGHWGWRTRQLRAQLTRERCKG
jgi:hypothetical protein